MVVSNYWNYLGYFGKKVPSKTEDLYVVPGIRMDDGVSYSIRVGMNNDVSTMIQCEKNYALKYDLLAKIGTSDDAEAANQYVLGSDITSYFPDFTYTITSSVDTDKIKLKITISGTCNNSSGFTVREIGILKKVWCINNAQHNCMFIRHVLEEPFFVPYGESFTKTYQWVEQ